MKRLSITVRLTLLFILLLSVAGAGIVWTLYNGLASELKWRDDTTLINRTAQIKQLLIDGVNPDTLPVYFNRMMDVSQDILIIHGDGINKIVNRTNVSDDMLNNIPASETISAAGIYRSIINDTEIDALRINIDEVSPSLTVTVAKLASARHNMLEQYKINSIIICIVAIVLCSVLSPLLIRTGLREIKKLSGVTEALNYNDSREPVEVSALPRELKPLGQALNKMHQALVKDFERLSQFADDLAHELRTPINALLGQNQVTLSQTRSIAEYQKTIAGNIEELENISRLTENILFLARADKNNVLVKLDSLSLNKEVENLLDYLEYLSDEKEICFKVECNQQIFADKILLQRMLSSGKSHFYYCTVRSVFRHGNPISRTEHIIGRKLDSGYQPHNRIFENQHQDSCRSTQSGKNIHRIFINQGTDYNDHPYTNHNQFYHLIYPFQRMIL